MVTLALASGGLVPPASRDSMGVVGRHDLAYVRTRQAFGSGNAADSPLARPMIAAGAVFGALLAATLGLWAYYGSAVFFETIAAGIAACL